MKTCFKCKVEKPLSEFYRHSQMKVGLLGKCKKCTCADVEARRKIKMQDPVWVEAERERHKEKSRRYVQIGIAKRNNRRHRNRRKGLPLDLGPREPLSPEQLKFQKIANTALSNAIRDNRIARKPCEVCGINIRVQGHHEDYSKPLDVNWLCTRHHAKRHTHLRDMKTLGQSPTPITEFIAELKSKLTNGDKAA